MAAVMVTVAAVAWVGVGDWATAPQHNPPAWRTSRHTLARKPPYTADPTSVIIQARARQRRRRRRIAAAAAPAAAAALAWADAGGPHWRWWPRPQHRNPAPSKPSPPSRAGDSTPGGFTPLTGYGGSWAAPAIDRWSENVSSRGIVVNFVPDGDAAGREEFILDQADFGASDIPFLATPDPFQGGIEHVPWAYSYIPVVAGGVAFPYNLVVAGKKITNLRLSGATITKIFTGQITNWDNKNITRDYGRQLPSIPITVVVHAESSGESYQLSRWMWREYTAQWQKFCTRSGGPARHCGPTEFYPVSALPDGVTLNGSELVADYIASTAGAIGYDEYAYALGSSLPVAKVRNAAGRYTLPTPSNVTISLEKATINQNPREVTFLIQNLDRVYTDTNPRAYPLSSYSYLIIPRDKRVINGTTYGPPPIFNDAKGKTLTTWLRYALCAGQRTAGHLGYAPLPASLIKAAFTQLSHVPGHISPPTPHQLTRCIKAT
jgi:ABC-type phosphate transport system substrate-binding protein